MGTCARKRVPGLALSNVWSPWTAPSLVATSSKFIVTKIHEKSAAQNLVRNVLIVVMSVQAHVENVKEAVCTFSVSMNVDVSWSVGIFVNFPALLTALRALIPATIIVFTVIVQGSAMNHVIPAWNPVNGNASTSNAQHDVVSDATDLHVICHVQNNCHVATPALDYVERYVLRNVVYATEKKLGRSSLELRMNQMQDLLSSKIVAIFLKLKDWTHG